MIPFLHLGPLTIPIYGLMMAIAFLLAAYFAEREFRRKGLGRNVAWDTTVVAMITGLVGSRVNYLLEHPEELRHFFKAVFSGTGLTWYGGFILGLVAVLLYWRRRKVPIRAGLDALAPSAALGYAVARIGCLLSGDGDYGRATNLPWGMAFPNGLVPTLDRVHPTPIYETLLMTGLFLFLRMLNRKNYPAGVVFYVYLVAAGLERFLIEFLRRNSPVALGLTEAQLMSIGMMVVGGVLAWRALRPQPAAPRPGQPARSS